MNNDQKLAFSKSLENFNNKYKEDFKKRGGINFYVFLSKIENEDVLYIDPFLKANIIEEIKEAFELALK